MKFNFPSFSTLFVNIVAAIVAASVLFFIVKFYEISSPVMVSDIIIAIIAAIVLYLIVNFYESKAIAKNSTSGSSSDFAEKVKKLKRLVERIKLQIAVKIDDQNLKTKEQELDAARDMLTKIETSVKFIENDLEGDQNLIEMATESSETLETLTTNYEPKSEETKIESLRKKFEAFNEEVEKRGEYVNLKDTIKDKRFTNKKLRNLMKTENQSRIQVVLFLEVNKNGIGDDLKVSTLLPTYPRGTARVIVNKTGNYIAEINLSNFVNIIDPKNNKGNGRITIFGIGVISSNNIVSGDHGAIIVRDFKNNKINSLGMMGQTLVKTVQTVIFSPIVYNGSLKDKIELKIEYSGEYTIFAICSWP